MTSKGDDVKRGTAKMIKFCINNISGNIEAVFYKLGTRNVQCTSKKKPNDTQGVVPMETILAPVSFCQKPNILISNPYNISEIYHGNRKF